MAGWSKEADEAARASIKEAADKERAARARRERLEAEKRGEIDAKGIVDAMDAFDGKDVRPLDAVAEIVARLGKEES